MNEGNKKEKVSSLQAVICDRSSKQENSNIFSREPCRKASKAASQKKWLNKPENKSYFRGPDNVKRVQERRLNNPGYWKRTKHSTALQDCLMTQPIENNTDNGKIDVQPLQNLLTAQPPVIIGLISNLIDSALQDEIASTLLRMQQSGQEILFFKPQNQGGTHDCKNPDFKTKNQEGAQQLRLDRSPAG